MWFASTGWPQQSKRFFPGAPDLAVEILSPNNIRSELDDRLRDFFASATQITWIINPEEECVELCRSPEKRTLIGIGAMLNREELLPGFRYPIAELFASWDWE